MENVSFQVDEGQSHGDCMFLAAPESKDAQSELATFFAKHLAR